MPRKFKIEWNKQTMALAITGGVLALEVIVYGVMMALGQEVPEMYISFMFSTLTVLGAIGGAQYINGMKDAEA